MIQVNGLKKAFDGFVALNGVDMHVEKGAIYGLVGPNGAGKVHTHPPPDGGVPSGSGRGADRRGKCI